MIKLKILILSIIACLAICEEFEAPQRIDDEKCDAQLAHFTESLGKRDTWALECKSNDLKLNVRLGTVYG